MRRETILEIKVGAFVLLGLVILVFIIFSIGDIFRLNKGYELDVIFKSVGGVDIGSPVRLAGVSVGEIKGIEIFNEPSEKTAMVKLRVWLKRDAIVKDIYRAQIRTLGLLGEKYLEIMPAVEGERIGRPLGPDDVLQGEEPVSLEDAMELFRDRDVRETLRQTLKNTSELLEKLNKLTNEENLENVRQILTNLKSATEDLDVTVSSVNNILTKIEKGEGELGKFINESKIYDDLSALAADLRKHPWKILYRGGSKVEPTRGKTITPVQRKREESGHGIP